MFTRLIRSLFVIALLGEFHAPAAVLYVNFGSTNPVPPFSSWATAATNIQDAVDAASPGDQVLVTNGIYDAAGRPVDGYTLTNRVTVSQPITVQSVNGPLVTVIEGYQVPGDINGDSAVRCVYLGSNAVLAGFTLTNGATLNDFFESFDFHLYLGGGVSCEAGASVSNCIITGCSASDMGGGFYADGGFSGITTNALLSDSMITGCYAPYGGGACGAILNDCALSNNQSWYGGGAMSCVLSNCTLSSNAAIFNGDGVGGGAALCTLTDCELSGNAADGSGGGAYNTTMADCTFSANVAKYGGGAAGCTLTNCELTGGVATNNGGGIEGCTAGGCTLTGNSAMTGGGADSSTLYGCVLTGNSSTNAGGGAENSTLNNCSLFSDSAGSNGGGADGSTLNNCAMAGNFSAYDGGGAENGTLNNCTLSGNSAFNSGGGADNCTLNSCIAFLNAAPTQANYSSSTLNYCCTTPLPANGANNITADPQLTDAAHIGAGSPCIGAGSANYSTGVDIDGDPWANPPSIGCDEYQAGPVTGPLSVAIQAGFTNMAAGLAVNFSGLITGHASMEVWDFGDGTQATNQLALSHSWVSAGVYPVVLTAYNDDNPAGVSATVVVVVVSQSVAYVSAGNLNPVAPYLTWDTAAANIQDAADSVEPGGTVWVTNGVYQHGGRVVFGLLTNRVALTKPIKVRSVNGPSVTMIEGVPVLGDSAVRCTYLTNGATLAGFTLTNGGTRTSGDYVREGSGGGAFCESAGAVLSNCVVTSSTATIAGGGDYQGTLEECVLNSNEATYFGNGSGGGADSAVLIGCVLSNNVSYYGGGAENSTLLDCALTGNFTYTDSDYTANGGGASGCLLTNCVLAGNSSLTGGGASGCTLVNCALTGNSTILGDGVWPPDGGGANGSTLMNCTVTGNSANSTGGGVNSCILTNCIVYFNTAPNGSNYSADSTLAYCDASPLATNDSNNLASDPLFADWEHISVASPCRGAGNAAAVTGVDIDGDAWLNPPSIGCDEYDAGSAVGALGAAFAETFTNVATGFTVDFTAQISGHATSNRWDLGDGTVVSNELLVSHSWAAAGNYTVTFTAYNPDNAGGVSASATIFVLQNPVHYVSLAATNPVAPYLSWATAATNIQDAADTAYAGGTVMVSNGVYQTGVRVLYGFRTNRVAVTRPLTLQSVNGAAATVIDGGFATRCLYLSNNITVTGFTLQNGMESTGAGVYCETGDVLNDCVITNNSSPAGGSGGGGANGGTLNHCLLAGNSASYLGGGAAGATLNFCVISNNTGAAYGGGACYCTLNNCVVTGNAGAWGGGVDASTMSNSLCVGNQATYAGGGAIWSTLDDCTVVSNAVDPGPGTYGGDGAYGVTLNNSIVYYNNTDSNGVNCSGCSLDHCCTTPDPGGISDITNEPLFVNPAVGDYHLQSNSPCINAGNNADVLGGADLDGNPRIVGGTVDIGAYEFQNPASIISYAWLQQYGFATDGSADFTDTDGSGMNHWQDWIAGLNPNNPLSVLKMSSATSSGTNIVITWQSVANINYLLQRATNLAAQPAFQPLASNIVGQAGTTSYTDTNAPAPGPYFYRVGVQ
jgi:PKD repeat protein